MTLRSSPARGAWPVRPAVAAVALLTPPGRGALAVVGLWGPEAGRMVTALFVPRGKVPLSDWEPGRIGVGRWRGGARGAVAAEEVLVVRVHRGWEVHCHGGNAAAAAVVDDLTRLGAEPVPSAAWQADGAGLVAAEARSLLASVDAPRGARILCRQMAGELDHELARIKALVEQGAVDGARRCVERLRRAARVGLRLAEPWRVVISGRVNAGKSSLVNALAGHARCLVSPQPGTTRDVIETPVVLEGWSVVLVDTAGLRDHEAEASGETERVGIARARAAAAAADLVIRVVEVGESVPPGSGLVVWSKTDLRPGLIAPPEIVATSSRSGAGIVALVDAMIARLVPESGEPGLLDGAVPFLPRHLELLERTVGADPAGERPVLQ